MGDGSFLAFFEAPDRPFEFKEQHDFDLHIALEVDDDTLERMLEKGRAEGVDTRGVADHGFVRSIYFRDPNGYVTELCSKTATHAVIDDKATEARQVGAGGLAGLQAASRGGGLNPGQGGSLHAPRHVAAFALSGRITGHPGDVHSGGVAI